MAKKIILPLEMANGVKARTLEELKNSWDLESVISYYFNGRLLSWLKARRYVELAEQVAALQTVSDKKELPKHLCNVFTMPFEEEKTIDVEEIENRNVRIEKLRKITADDELFKKIESVALDQKDLMDLVAKKVSVIYLVKNTFTIPLAAKNIKYIGVDDVIGVIESKESVDFSALGISFENVKFDEKYENYASRIRSSQNENCSTSYTSIKQSADTSVSQNKESPLDGNSFFGSGLKKAMHPLLENEKDKNKAMLSKSQNEEYGLDRIIRKAIYGDIDNIYNLHIMYATGNNEVKKDLELADYWNKQSELECKFSMTSRTNIKEGVSLSQEYEKLEGRVPRIQLASTEGKDNPILRYLAITFREMQCDVHISDVWGGTLEEMVESFTQDAVDEDAPVLFYCCANNEQVLATKTMVEVLENRGREDILPIICGRNLEEYRDSLFEYGAVTYFDLSKNIPWFCANILRLLVERAEAE